MSSLQVGDHAERWEERNPLDFGMGKEELGGFGGY